MFQKWAQTLISLQAVHDMYKIFCFYFGQNLGGGRKNFNDSKFETWFRRPCNVLRMPQQFHVKLQEPKALAESTQPFSILAAKKAPLGHRQTSKTAWWWPVPFDELPFPFWSNPFPVWSNPLSLGMNTSVLPKVICKRHETFIFAIHHIVLRIHNSEFRMNQ